MVVTVKIGRKVERVALEVGMRFEHVNAGSLREIRFLDEADQMCKVAVTGGYGGEGIFEYTPADVARLVKTGVWAKEGC